MKLLKIFALMLCLAFASPIQIPTDEVIIPPMAATVTINNEGFEDILVKQFNNVDIHASLNMSTDIPYYLFWYVEVAKVGTKDANGYYDAAWADYLTDFEFLVPPGQQTIPFNYTLPIPRGDYIVIIGVKSSEEMDADLACDYIHLRIL